MPRFVTAALIWLLALTANAINAWVGEIPVVSRLIVAGSAVLLLAAHLVLVSRLNALQGTLALGTVASAVALPAFRMLPPGEQMAAHALPLTLGLTFLVASVGAVWCAWQVAVQRRASERVTSPGLDVRSN